MHVRDATCVMQWQQSVLNKLHNIETAAQFSNFD